LKIEDLYKCEQWDIPAMVLISLNELFRRIQNLEIAYIAGGGSPLVITNGFRTWSEHKEIYRKLDQPVRLHSKHLTGDACDILDKDQSLKIWVGKNKGVIERPDIDLYCEAFTHTPYHLHVQTIAPPSHNRFFIP
jgi:hypothetical protein